jgi:RNA polymerase sigma-70 factor (ECF subfamily)
VLLGQARRHRVRRRPRTVASDVSADGRGSLSPADRVDVERAVGALPRRQREVITLYYLADLGVAEVGQVLGISAGSVKSHLHDARANLRTALEER